MSKTAAEDLMIRKNIDSFSVKNFHVTSKSCSDMPVHYLNEPSNIKILYQPSDRQELNS